MEEKTMYKEASNYNIALDVARSNGNVAHVLDYKRDAQGIDSIDESKLSLFEQDPQIANEFIGTMSNKIVAQYAYDIFRGFDMPFGWAMKTMSQLGDAEEYITNELAEVEDDTDDDTSPFSAPKPKIINSFIKTELKKRIGVKIEEPIWRGAFVTEGGLANIVGIILKNLRDSLNLIAYDELCKKVADKEAFSKYLVVEKVAAKGATAQAQKCYEQIMALVNKMMLPSVNYNTSAKRTITPKGRFVLLLNADYKASFDINVLASLFHSSTIELSKYFKEVRVVDFPATASTQIGFICDDEALVWGYRLDIAGSIYDPKHLAMVTWVHRWLKIGEIKTRNAVRLLDTNPA